MALQLRGCAAPTEGQVLFLAPTCHSQPLGSSSSGGSGALFWPLWVSHTLDSQIQAGTFIYTQKCHKCGRRCCPFCLFVSKNTWMPSISFTTLPRISLLFKGFVVAYSINLKLQRWDFAVNRWEGVFVSEVVAFGIEIASGFCTQMLPCFRALVTPWGVSAASPTFQQMQHREKASPDHRVSVHN